MRVYSAHPWLKPLPRRVAVTLFCAGWVAFEIWQQSTFWLIAALGVLAYAIWDFFLSGNYRRTEGADRVADDDRTAGPDRPHTDSERTRTERPKGRRTGWPRHAGSTGKLRPKRKRDQ
jgi:hypothetical protein